MYVLLITSLISTVVLFTIIAIILKLAGRESNGN